LKNDLRKTRICAGYDCRTKIVGPAWKKLCKKCWVAERHGNSIGQIKHTKKVDVELREHRKEQTAEQAERLYQEEKYSERQRPEPIKKVGEVLKECGIDLEIEGLEVNKTIRNNDKRLSKKRYAEAVEKLSRERFSVEELRYYNY